MSAGALALLGVLVCALYLPYLGNPPVFDDRFFFSGYGFAEYASFPLGWGLRYPPYFSIGIVQVLFGSIEAHRVVSLIAHVASVWTLYVLLLALQLGRSGAFIGAALFGLHPAAVYGAAYLAQRSIVFATFFSLLTLLLFLRGLRSERISDALAAAVLYSLAVLSKEHAILLPAAAAALAPLSGATRSHAQRYIAAFFAACAPAAIFVVLSSRGVIGVAYEAQFRDVAAQVAAEGMTQALASPWLGSALAQMALFFRYLFVWLIPATSEMSLDLRVDFAHLWSPPVALPAVLGFAAIPIACGFLILRRGRLALAAWGLLYMWILFGTELSAVRFQEPFVLYRSYLWAPGLAVAVASAFDRLSPRVLVALLAPALLFLVWQARDRLETFSSGLALWEDAAAKLPTVPVPGGYRTLYELGREYMYAGRPKEASDVVDRCLRDYPRVLDCAFARAAVQIQTEQYERALKSMLYVLTLRPDHAVAYHHLGYVLENLGCRKEALAQYRISLKLGYLGARYRIDSIENPGKGLLAAKKMPAEVDCSDLLRRYPIPGPPAPKAGTSG